MDDNNFGASGVVQNMRATLFIVLSLVLLSSCRDRPSQPPPTTAASTSATAGVHPAASIASTVASSTEAPEVTPDPFAPVMTDTALGALIESLSEPTGDFPSDNFVSNETSYLHVADDLSNEQLKGKVYVGVGPEQNLTYVTMMRPAMAFIVDIRRQNMLEHMVFRALGEDANNRATFLARLTGRDMDCCTIAKPELASFDEIADALAEQKPSDERIENEVQRSLALMARLEMKRRPTDERSVRKVLQAFARKGLDLAYSMEGSARRYPEVRKLLAMTDDAGEQRSFVADESSFQYLQGMWRANRIVPVVGDFSGDKALRGIAEEARRRKLVLGVFYTSNVEQYLFEGGTYGDFIDNVSSFPTDDASRFIRVWFDQGRAHTDQRKGHRTTSVSMPMQAFFERHGKRPFATYWQVMTYDGKPR